MKQKDVFPFLDRRLKWLEQKVATLPGDRRGLHYEIGEIEELRKLAAKAGIDFGPGPFTGCRPGQHASECRSVDAGGEAGRFAPRPAMPPRLRDGRAPRRADQDRVHGTVDALEDPPLREEEWTPGAHVGARPRGGPVTRRRTWL